jgi:8-oxo-dGTP pyrophosphatase MutT (NUDIX family)
MTLPTILLAKMMHPDLSESYIRRALAAHSPTLIDNEALMPSAVLVPLLQTDDGYRVLFTVRTSRVEHHKGEVSFPGGARDPEDASLETTALRETFEEVGIRQDHIQLLGRLNDMETRSGFHITPFVGFIPASYAYDPSRIEVDEVLEVPFNDLWEVYRQGPREFAYGQASAPTLAYEFHHDGHRIWGATARILTDFFDLLVVADKG